MLDPCDAIQRDLSGYARWAILRALYELFQFLLRVDIRDKSPASSSSHLDIPKTATPEQCWHMAKERVEQMELRGWPFSGFFQAAWGGEHGGAGLGEANTWFVGDDLQELPRRVWLPMNDPVSANARPCGYEACAAPHHLVRSRACACCDCTVCWIACQCSMNTAGISYGQATTPQAVHTHAGAHVHGELLAFLDVLPLSMHPCVAGL